MVSENDFEVSDYVNADGSLKFGPKARPACGRCGHDDVVGPFEMDGFVGGEYRVSGEQWIVCRKCHGSTNVTARVAS